MTTSRTHRITRPSFFDLDLQIRCAPRPKGESEVPPSPTSFVCDSAVLLRDRSLESTARRVLGTSITGSLGSNTPAEALYFDKVEHVLGVRARSLPVIREGEDEH